MVWSWWFLAILPGAWFLQNCLHELSHLIYALFYEGHKPIGFWPYPHTHNGRFYFARYKIHTDGKPADRLRHIVPFWQGVFCVISLFIMSTLVKEENRIFILPFIITNFVDALFFWWGYFWGSDYSDGKRFRHGR